MKNKEEKIFLSDEPSLDQIEDYNDNESPEKRNTVKLVVLFCIIVSIAYGFLKFSYNTNDDYIGTKDQPGINTTKN